MLSTTTLYPPIKLSSLMNSNKIVLFNLYTVFIFKTECIFSNSSNAQANFFVFLNFDHLSKLLPQEGHQLFFQHNNRYPNLLQHHCDCGNI